MYKVAARIQGADVVEVALDRTRASPSMRRRSLNAGSRHQAAVPLLAQQPDRQSARLSGHRTPGVRARGLGIVVVDEAYAEFSGRRKLRESAANTHDNLVVLRTLSKAYALAGARCGALLGDPALVELLRRMIPPYAVPAPTLDARASRSRTAATRCPRAIELIVRARTADTRRLRTSRSSREVWPSAPIFCSCGARTPTAHSRVGPRRGPAGTGISSTRGLENCLRITVGTPEQNERLLAAVAVA